MGTRVYIGELPYGCQDRDLEKFFKGYGKIHDILIKNGFGFVEFEDYADADDAVYELNGKSLLGKRLLLEIARGPSRRSYGRGGERFSKKRSWLDKYGPPTRTGYRLIVENLSSRVSWQDLKDYMRQAGDVTYADAHKQRRNEGVVEFATYADMKSALNKLNDTELSGRTIKLIEDRPRHSRRSRSRSYSRSRSRSRSSRDDHSRSRSPRYSKTPSKSRSSSRSQSKSQSRSPRRSTTPSNNVGKSRSRSMSRSPVKSDEKSSLSKSPRPDIQDENED